MTDFRVENKGGGVSSVSNSDGTMTISPTTGPVVASRPAITGDVSVPVTSNASTLATVNSNVGSFTNASITVNGKGLVTAASSGTTPTSLLFIQTADATVSNTVTETSIIGSGTGSLTLSSNFFTVGKTIRLRIGGVYSTPAISTPSVLIKIKYGATVLASVTTTGLLSGASALEFDGEALITCRSTGTSGTVAIHGDIEYSTGVAGTISVDSLNNGGSVATINTTTSNLLDVTVAWDSATTTRIIKTTVISAESLN